jgi:hypothetical protein
MKPHSRIDELLAHARRLVSLPLGNAGKSASGGGNPASSADSTVPKALGASCAIVTKQCLIVVGSAHLRVRLLADANPTSGLAGTQPSHMEALLPAINHHPAMRVRLCRDHWKLLTRWLQGPAKQNANEPQQASPSSALSALQAPSQGSDKKTRNTPDVAVGVGAHLYVLDAGKLYHWATNHWGSVAEMEAVCDAYRHNSTAWRQKHKGDWSVPERFLECLERLMLLREVAARAQRIEAASHALPEIPHSDSTEVVDPAYDECLEYAVLLEDVLFGWNSREQLLIHAEHLRDMLRSGTANLPTDLRLRRVLELIEMRKR